MAKTHPSVEPGSSTGGCQPGGQGKRQSAWQSGCLLLLLKYRQIIRRVRREPAAGLLWPVRQAGSLTGQDDGSRCMTSTSETPTSCLRILTLNLHIGFKVFNRRFMLP